MTALAAVCLGLAAALAVPGPGPRSRLRPGAGRLRAAAEATGRSGGGRHRWVAVAGAVALAGFALGPIPAVAVAALLVAATRLRRRAAAERRESRQLEAWVRLLAALEAALGVGLAPAEALLAALPAPPERGGRDRRHPPLDAAVRAALAVSGSPVPALARAGPAQRALALAWQLNARTGAALGPAVALLRERAERCQAEDLELTQALASSRASRRLLALLAPAGLLLGSGLGVDPVRVLLRSPIGHLCLLAGAGFEVAGMLLGDWLAARARQPAA
jgi:tight adherence protein B